jgi:hypothetical protein
MASRRFGGNIRIAQKNEVPERWVTACTWARAASAVMAAAGLTAKLIAGPSTLRAARGGLSGGNGAAGWDRS